MNEKAQVDTMESKLFEEECDFCRSIFDPDEFDPDEETRFHELICMM